jgi:hypothetical protein
MFLDFNLTTQGVHKELVNLSLLIMKLKTFPPGGILNFKAPYHCISE